MTATASLTLDGGDTYAGAAQTRSGVTLPHGEGVWRSSDGASCYEGHFVHRWRDGYGRLSTPSFTLWARWRMDRPDLSAATRVDYANGDRYCGFIELKVRRDAQSNNSKGRSKFSIWASAIEPVRQRWGELVKLTGDAYVGEWKDDVPEGFGCHVWASGSRYTGRLHRGQFSNVGTLFIAAGEMEGCFSRLGSGGWRWAATAIPAERNGTQTQHTRAAAHVRGVSRWPPLTRPAWDGVLVDGVWADGRCHGEGHVTLPGGARISADWRTASSPVDGELVLPSLTPQARVDADVHEWRESFQWESLFTAEKEEAGAGVAEKVAATRLGIQQSVSAEVVKSCIVELLNTHERVRSALHVFRRCFYGLYGTCGVASEIGAGGGVSNLGWCALRNPYGGCIHGAQGRPIRHGDLDLALRDVASLARSAVRWVLELVGPTLQAKVLDCGGEAVIGRWVADRIFQHCYPVLLNLYRQVYAEEEAALAASLLRLRGVVSLDDMGVLFARQSASQARLFDPYTDAVHCVEQLNGSTQTLTTLLKVLVQWSREIDLSTRLTQASHEGGGPRGGGGGRGGTSGSKTAAGSADDLLPIHQYVLSQSRCSDLYAVTRLLTDFANEVLFMEATSQEAFGVTTLQVCVLTLLRLHPWERDATRVMVPFSVTMHSVEDVVRLLPANVAAWAATVAYTAAAPPAETAVDVEAVLRPYAALWVPRLVGWIGEHMKSGVGSDTSSCCFALQDADFTPQEVALAQPRPADCGELTCVCCWLFASCLLGALHLRLSVDDVELPSSLANAAAVQAAWQKLSAHVRCDASALQLRVELAASTHVVPSRLLRLEVYLQELLSSPQC